MKNPQKLVNKNHRRNLLKEERRLASQEPKKSSCSWILANQKLRDQLSLVSRDATKIASAVDCPANYILQFCAFWTEFFEINSQILQDVWIADNKASIPTYED